MIPYHQSGKALLVTGGLFIQDRYLYSMIRNHCNYLIGLAFMLFTKAGMTQSERVAIVDVYGLRTITESQLLQALPLKPNDVWNNPLWLTDSLLKKLPVKEAFISPVCCDPASNGMIIFVGIAEKQQPPVQYNPRPGSPIRLPPGITAVYDSMMNLMIEGILKGEANEDRSNGYSLIQYPPAREKQLRFRGFATGYFTELKNVLRHSADEHERAVAATVIAYHTDKKAIIPELMHAVHDPAEEVRNNATRALALLAAYANEHPGENLQINPSPFVEMIRSIVWTDRNKGIAVLDALTQSRDKTLLQQLKTECLDELAEMAAWKSTGHAFSPFIILCRIAGISEEKAFASIDLPNRKAFVAELLKQIRTP